MRAKATYHVSRFTLSFPDWLAIVGFVCLGRFLFFVWVVFFWSIRSQENVVYYDLVWIRKIATVVTMSAAIGQKNKTWSPNTHRAQRWNYVFFFQAFPHFFTDLIIKDFIRKGSMSINWASLRMVNGVAGGKMSDRFCRWATYWKRHDMSVTLICKILIDPQNFRGLFCPRIIRILTVRKGSYEFWQFEADAFSDIFFEIQFIIWLMHFFKNFDPVSYYGIGSPRFLYFYRKLT